MNDFIFYPKITLCSLKAFFLLIPTFACSTLIIHIRHRQQQKTNPKEIVEFDKIHARDQYLSPALNTVWAQGSGIEGGNSYSYP